MEQMLLLLKEVVVLLLVTMEKRDYFLAHQQQRSLVGERVDGHGRDEMDPRGVIPEDVHTHKGSRVLLAGLDQIVHGGGDDEKEPARGEERTNRADLFRFEVANDDYLRILHLHENRITPRQDLSGVLSI